MIDWIAMSDKVPADDQIVLGWIVDDNTSIGGYREESAEIIRFRDGLSSQMTHWAEIEPPGATPRGGE